MALEAATSANFATLARVAGLDPTSVIPKAQEILRLMEIKCRLGCLGKGEICRSVLAFDLACRCLDQTLHRRTVVKLCGVPEGVYVSALSTAQGLLGMRKRCNPEEVGRIVGGKRVGVMAAQELKRYEESFLASCPPSQRKCVDIGSALYAVAVFYLCAKKLKHPVDKERLLELSLASEEEFSNVCKSVLEHCYSTLGIGSDKPKLQAVPCLKPQLLSQCQAGDCPTSTPGNNILRKRIPLLKNVDTGAGARGHMKLLEKGIVSSVNYRTAGYKIVRNVESGGEQQKPSEAKRQRTGSAVSSSSGGSTATPGGARPPQAVTGTGNQVKVANPYARTVPGHSSSRQQNWQNPQRKRLAGGRVHHKIASRRLVEDDGGAEGSKRTSTAEGVESEREEREGYEQWKQRVIAPLGNISTAPKARDTSPAQAMKQASLVSFFSPATTGVSSVDREDAGDS